MKKNLFFIFLLLGSTAFQCDEDIDLDECIDPDRIIEVACTTDYAPVCGCDLQTYSNSCVADSAGLISWTEGECP